MNKNTEQFKWDDKLAMELCEYVGMRVGKDKDIRQQVELLTEDFKQSKSKKAPKEEQVPIKVQMISFYTSMSEKLIRDVFSVRLTGDISEDKLQSIKEAIEGVLNDESSDKKYTESELLQARRDAFDAAREVVGYSDALKNSPVTVGRKYKDNEDYINSLNK